MNTETTGIAFTQMEVSNLLQNRRKAIDEVRHYSVAASKLNELAKELSDEISDIETELLAILHKNQCDRIDTPLGSITKQDSKPSVEVFDIAMLPEHFKKGKCELPFEDIPSDMLDKFEIVPLKNLIAAALKEGEVPGAQLNDGKPYLKIWEP